MCIRNETVVKNTLEKSNKGGKTMDNTNRNKVNLVLYIVLTLIVVAVVCMTVIGISNNSKKPSGLPKVTNDPKVTDKITDTPSTKIPDNTDIPNDTDGNPDTDAGANQDEPSKEVDAPISISFTKPVEGYLLKAHDIDMPVYSLTMNDYRVHAGIDILAEPGSPVMAVAEGKIENIYNDPMMGNCISISHADGLTSHYKGLSDEVCEGIEEGALVYCGQVISSVGDSTLIEIAEESHLHFEMKKDGNYVNPVDYVSYEKTSADAEDNGYEG